MEEFFSKLKKEAVKGADPPLNGAAWLSGAVVSNSSFCVPDSGGTCWKGGSDASTS